MIWKTGKYKSINQRNWADLGKTEHQSDPPGNLDSLIEIIVEFRPAQIARALVVTTFEPSAARGFISNDSLATRELR